MLSEISPGDLGLPYSGWRRYQDRAILESFEAYLGGERVVVAAAPTGSGKSLIYMALSVMLGVPSVILVSTKALQDQLVGDFGELPGVVVVKGRNAYVCAANRTRTAEECTERLRAASRVKEAPACVERIKGLCEHYNVVNSLRKAKVIITNYAWWCKAGRLRAMLPEVGFLVMDEAHDSPFTLASLMSTTVSQNWCYLLKTKPLGQEPEWGEVLEWAEALKTKLEIRRDRIAAGRMDDAGVKELNHIVNTLESLEMILSLRDPADWIYEVDGHRFKVGPIWPKEYTEKVLFRRIPRIFMTSATLFPRTVELMGVENYKWLEYPSTFPVARRPLIYVPTTPPVRVVHGMSDGEKTLWVAAMDKIIRPRIHTKGIIHAVSYDRAKYIKGHSEFGRHMILHTTLSTYRMIRRFKESKPPAILVSPSVETGHDFPYEQCGWQIIAKIPFPSVQDKLTKARSKRVEKYGAYVAMQRMVQAYGRGMRAADDCCEVFVVDANVAWFMRTYGSWAPKWFRDAYLYGTTQRKERGDGS